MAVCNRLRESWGLVRHLRGRAEPVSVRRRQRPSKAKGSTAQKHVVEMSPWEQATHGREELEAIRRATRTKADYARALDGFRAIYHEQPQSKYAAAAVYAVAELLAEQGRDLNDAKS